MSRALVRVCVLILAAFACVPAEAQRELSPREIMERRERGAEVQAEAFAKMRAGDYEGAEALFREHIEIEPGNFAPRYNLACALSMQGRADEGVEFLAEAIERGFLDLEYMKRDSSLRAVRETDAFGEIDRAWRDVLDGAGDAMFERAKKKYGPRYRYETDSGMRVYLASSFHPLANDAAMEEMRVLYDWSVREIFTDLRGKDERELSWSLVVLPTERDFNRWAIARYGPGAVSGSFHRVGGAYIHDDRTLVSMDLGSTFRHEFLHVLHWRSNVHAGHVHPIWIQEGICSLVEDVEFERGGVRPVGSWRTNMLKRRAGKVKLIPLREFTSMGRGAFSGDSPLANYAMARAVFLYLYERDDLRAFYEDLVENFEEDPTGLSSLERAVGMDAEAIDEDFARWLRGLEEVPEVRTDGRMVGVRASIGAAVDPGVGEGPIVTRVLSRDARSAGLKMRDVIVAIDGRPVRDMNDYARVMGSVFPGQRVRVEVRRRDELLELDVPTGER